MKPTILHHYISTQAEKDNLLQLKVAIEEKFSIKLELLEQYAGDGDSKVYMRPETEITKKVFTQIMRFAANFRNAISHKDK